MSTISGAERPAITVSDLVFHWPDGTPVLGDDTAGFNLVVPPGRSGLVGVNGSGKSTLMALLAGDDSQNVASSPPPATSRTSHKTSRSTSHNPSTSSSGSRTRAQP